MEFTFRTVVVMILILVGLLVFATLIMGWGADMSKWFRLSIEPLSESVGG